VSNNGSMWRLIMTEPYSWMAINPKPRPTETLLPTVTKLVAQRCNATDLGQLQAAGLTPQFSRRNSGSERATRMNLALRITKSIVRLSEATT
jgi:hypothetical protein